MLKTQSLEHLWQSQELDHLDHAGDIKNYGNYGNGECDQLAKNRLCDYVVHNHLRPIWIMQNSGTVIGLTSLV